jgi:hypothetical protein
VVRWIAGPDRWSPDGTSRRPSTRTSLGFQFDQAVVAPTGQLGVWSVEHAHWLHRSTVERPLGRLLPCGQWVIGLYDYPRLIEPATGVVVAEWPEVAVQQKEHCFGVTHVPTPVAVLHPDGKRLAVVQAIVSRS